MERKTKSKSKKKKLIIVLSVILFVVLTIFLITLLYIHNRINQINLVSENDNSDAISMAGIQNNTEDLIPALPEFEQELEEEDAVSVESPEEEIKALEGEIRKNLEDNSTPIIYDRDVFNILLIGSDTRSENGTGRSDAMLLVSINKKTKQIVITSLLRDIYLKIPSIKNYNRLNAAYAFGGADLLVQTIEQNFKLKVDRYSEIDFNSFVDVIDAVGGVTIDVTEQEIPVINRCVRDLNRIAGEELEKDYLTQGGVQLLNGKQALGYVRNRSVGKSDFGRTARQRKVLEQIFVKVKELNLIELSDLLDQVLPQVTTNLKEGEIFSLILSLPSYVKYDVKQWSVPLEDTYSPVTIRGMAVLGIDFNKNINELQDRIYGDKKKN